ncbi:MAG: OmpA family protein [Polyangiaceae bacterium]
MSRFQNSPSSPSDGSARSRLTAYCGAVLLCAAATACSHDQRPAVTPSPIVQAPQAKAPPAQQETVVVSERLKEKCNLPDTPKQDPQFDFDEAALRNRGESILDNIATCMLTGPMKEDRLVVTGHADPRGTEEYNQALGMRRSSSAEDYLVSRGVPAARLDVRSRGELDATGTDERSWQLDRRVDLDETNGELGANP